MTGVRMQGDSQPLIDLQQLIAGVRWRWRFWTAAGLVGVVLGFGAAFVIPSAVAVSGVLVAHEAGTNQEIMAMTDSSLAESSVVAEAALRSIGSTMSVTKFASTFGASGQKTGAVLVYTVRGFNDKDALARAGALADAFIADHIGRARSSADAVSKALSARRDLAESQLRDLDQGITANGAAPGGANSPDVSARTNLQSQISQLGEQIQEADAGLPAIQAGTQLVDGPRLDKSFKVALISNALIGMGLGLAIGVALAFVTGIVRGKPVLRREIAENLGASVIAQISDRPRRFQLPWRPELVEQDGDRVAATLARIVVKVPGAVSLLELGCAPVASKLAHGIAELLTTDRQVVLVDDLTAGNTDQVPVNPELQLVDARVLLPPPAAGELRIGVGSVRPGVAWTDLDSLGKQTVLIVQAGHASSEWLHTVARQLADLHIHVLGVVLVNPDPRDRSDGTLWNALHIALRGTWPASPMNGTASQYGAQAPGVEFLPAVASTEQNGRQH